MNRIPVVCGILIKDNKVLMSKRHKNKKEFNGYWEFPGGKCNINESKKDCIIREIKEELNVDIEFNKIIYKKKHIKKYNLYFCICNIINDKNIKKNGEIQEYRYFKTNDIYNLKLLHGDKDIIPKINNYLMN